MSFDAICEAERTRDSKSRRTRAMDPELRRAEILGAVAFLTGSTVLLVLGNGGAHFDLAAAAIYVLAVAVASHVRFDVGAGFTVPTQAVFVPRACSKRATFSGVTSCSVGSRPAAGSSK